MKNIYSKLLKEALLDKDWKKNKDIIDLLVQKGGYIGIDDHCRFLKSDINKFSSIVQYFKFDEPTDKFPLYYYIANMSSTVRQISTINENLSVLFEKNKDILFKNENISTHGNKESYKNILELILEEGYASLMAKLVEKSVLTKDDFQQHKNNILYSVGVCFLSDNNWNQGHMDEKIKNIELILNQQLLDKNDVLQSIFPRIGTSYLIYSGIRSNQTMHSTHLFHILNDINEDLKKIERLGLLTDFHHDSTTKKQTFSKLQEIVDKQLSTTMTMIKDLSQADGIYTDTIKQFIKICEPVLKFEENRKKFNISKDIFCLDKVMSDYQKIISQSSKNKVSDHGCEVHEEKMNHLIKTINSTIFENQLDEAKSFNNKIKI